MITSIINLSSLDGNNGFRLDGATGDASHISVSNAGDVNGGDFFNVMVGASFAGPNGSYSSSSYT